MPSSAILIIKILKVNLLVEKKLKSLIIVSISRFTGLRSHGVYSILMLVYELHGYKTRIKNDLGSLRLDGWRFIQLYCVRAPNRPLDKFRNLYVSM